MRAILHLIALAAALVLATGPPVAAEPPVPDEGATWFGPTLASRGDTLDGYADRLGATPSLVSLEVPYPLTDDARDLVAPIARQAAGDGTVLLLDARPTVDLADLDASDAAAFADDLATWERRPGTSFLVRFAPEMNGSWETWGQRPGDYLRTFRDLALALHEATGAGTVWAPVYGAGYPFRDSDGALDSVVGRDRAALDTDGDGELGPGDDPYAPYYPGDTAVDWVGLSLYRLGQSQALLRNARLPEAEIASRLAETWGYGDDADREAFVDRYAAEDQPLLIETAAPYNPAVDGDPELAVKRGWWRQVLDAATADPRIGGVSWLEVAREEPEVADVLVDWRVTSDPRIARALLRDLERTGVALAPVVPVRADRSQDDGPSSGRPSPGSEPTVPEEQGVPGWWWWTVAGALALALLVRVARPGWRYVPVEHDREGRDRRLDLARGVVLLGTVVVAVAVVGLDLVRVAAWVPPAAVGTLLVVSGLAHGRRDLHVTSLGGGPAAFSAHLKRGLVLYLVAVLLSVVHLLLDAAPGVTSPFGTYADAARLLDYPPPGSAARDLLALRLAPGPVVLLGLFALLAVAAAPLAAVVRRGWWWLALAVSWSAFAVGTWTGATLPGTGWEVAWPVLVWQLPFVHALALGASAHPDREVAPRLGPALLAGGLALAVGWALVTQLDAVAVPVMAVVASAALTSVALVTTAWRPLGTLLGWAGAAGRHPLWLSLLLVVAVVGAAQV